MTDFMDGHLDRTVQHALEQHLEGCTACSMLLSEVKEIQRELAAFPEVSVSEDLVRSILIKTSGVSARRVPWSEWLGAFARPFLSQRYAFATLLAFAFISFAVNVMGPGFSASSSSRLSPSALVAKADALSSQVYKGWREFNDFKGRVAEEVKLLKEDLIGRLDYHLVTILFRSYNETLKADTETDTDKEANEANKPEARKQNE